MWRTAAALRKIVMTLSALVCVPNMAWAAMPEGDGWNIGSVFAMAHQCEMRNFMVQGQTTPLMTMLLSRIAPQEQEYIRFGYQEGLKQSALYSNNGKRWVPVPMDAKACSTVQYTIDQYKAAAAFAH